MVGNCQDDDQPKGDIQQGDASVHNGEGDGAKAEDAKSMNGEPGGSIQEEPPEEPPISISDKAVESRMRRLMARRADGSTLVPEEVIKDWHNLDTRPNLKALFERTGYNKDPEEANLT